MSDIRIVHAFVEGEEGELIDELKERITRLEAQAVRWEAMYEGMMAERDAYWDDVMLARDALEGIVHGELAARGGQTPAHDIAKAALKELGE